LEDAETPKCLIICELVDSRTRRMIRSNAHLNCQADYLQTNNLVSRVLAMVVEKREFKLVLDELLGPEGNSFYLSNSSKYTEPDEQLSFLALSRRLMAEGQILVGYKEIATGASVINPPKLEERKWGGYVLIVMSNHEETERKKRQKEIDASTREKEQQGSGSIKGPSIPGGIKGPSIPFQMSTTASLPALSSGSDVSSSVGSLNGTRMMSHHLKTESFKAGQAGAPPPRLAALSSTNSEVADVSKSKLDSLQMQMQMQMEMQRQMQQQMKELQESVQQLISQPR